LSPVVLLQPYCLPISADSLAISYTPTEGGQAWTRSITTLSPCRCAMHFAPAVATTAHRIVKRSVRDTVDARQFQTARNDAGLYQLKWERFADVFAEYPAPL